MAESHKVKAGAATPWANTQRMQIVLVGDAPLISYKWSPRRFQRRSPCIVVTPAGRAK